MPRTGERGGPQTRARIREVANRMFLESGYDAVTVAEVAREAGVSSVTVFNHFPRKEDLFLDRQDDAVDLLREAVADRPDDVDALESLRRAVLRMFDERHPLSGVDERSAPFFRTVADSPALIARAREIAAELQAELEDALAGDPAFAGDPALFAALFLAGYAALLVGTAKRMLAGDDHAGVVAAHRERIDALFGALRSGLGT
ncbi:TetR/AcrR family transcriptional regulator [Galbitalea sp. SE-J8]|uniref:TetR/AcrR family transcriptional regulator n=1 Tax=Galbitalea sp. SE-J8 TaxID=3054952 RepID=UPI00259D020F|nr:TetR/AcrR family transcriptional regulator [Galbitalea sp. SE-J8]MDM4761836.1 TetR/AcrR family transcriptional regulator [Galbitalea sp. SE-J8]